MQTLRISILHHPPGEFPQLLPLTGGKLRPRTSQKSFQMEKLQKDFQRPSSFKKKNPAFFFISDRFSRVTQFSYARVKRLGLSEFLWFLQGRLTWFNNNAERDQFPMHILRRHKSYFILRRSLLSPLRESAMAAKNEKSSTVVWCGTQWLSLPKI